MLRPRAQPDQRAPPHRDLFRAHARSEVGVRAGREHVGGGVGTTDEHDGRVAARHDPAHERGVVDARHAAVDHYEVEVPALHQHRELRGAEDQGRHEAVSREGVRHRACPSGKGACDQHGSDPCRLPALVHRPRPRANAPLRARTRPLPHHPKGYVSLLKLTAGRAPIKAPRATRVTRPTVGPPPAGRALHDLATQGPGGGGTAHESPRARPAIWAWTTCSTNSSTGGQGKSGFAMSNDVSPCTADQTVKLASSGSPRIAPASPPRRTAPTRWLNASPPTTAGSWDLGGDADGGFMKRMRYGSGCASPNRT